PPPCRGGALPAELIARERVNCSAWGPAAINTLAVMIRRRWMAVSVLAVGAILVVACGSAAAASIRARITPTPKRGTPQTGFVIRFRAPVATGLLRNVRRQYELSF